MKYFTLLLTFLVGLNSFSQDEAYYIGQSNGNLIHTETKNNLTTAKHAYTFKDSIYEIKNSTFSFLQFDYTLTENKPLSDSTTIIFTQQGIGHNITTMDSILISNQWYKIYYHSDDDGFIGGMPNRMNKSVWVDGLGTVYSFNNFYNGHEILMLCHKDSAKQLVLNEVYKHLSQKNVWFNWSKMTALTQTYSFDNCLEKMSDLWLKTRKDIVIYDIKSTTINNTIRYKVTLKNVSKTNYTLPTYYSVAPAKAFVKINDSLQTWDLMKTHSGKHFSRTNYGYLLLPGDTISFTQTLNIWTGSSTIAKYDGFQIYSTIDFYNWLFRAPLVFEGKQYETFKFREILKPD